MSKKKKRPYPEDQREHLKRDRLPRLSQPRVSGRLSVEVKKTKQHGFLGMSIEADATAIVQKNGHTRIIRARPEPEKERKPSQDPDKR